jgi:hypothetical protein
MCMFIDLVAPTGKLGFIDVSDTLGRRLCDGIYSTPLALAVTFSFLCTGITRSLALSRPSFLSPCS